MTTTRCPICGAGAEELPDGFAVAVAAALRDERPDVCRDAATLLAQVADRPETVRPAVPALREALAQRRCACLREGAR